MLNYKKKKCGSQSKGNKYVVKKKGSKKRRCGIQHNFLLQFYLWFT